VLAACVAAVAAAPGIAAAAPRCAGLPAHGAFPVVDAANVVPPEPEAFLIADLLRFQQSDDVAIVAATVPDLGGDDVSSYTHRLFGCWGVGDAQSDNGVLIVVAMREHKVRIELGTGLVEKVDQEDLDAAVKGMAPSLRAGNVGDALRGAAVDVATATGGTLPDTAALVRSGGQVDDTGIPVSLGPNDAVPQFQPDAPGFEEPFRTVEHTASWLFVIVPIFIAVVFVIVIVSVIARGASGVLGQAAWRGGFPMTMGNRGSMGPMMYASGRWADPTSWMRPQDPPTLAAGGGTSSGTSGVIADASSPPSGPSDSGSGGSSFGGGSGSGGGASGSW
jgi:uncharacterized protein